jgi:hypothetical protein
VLLGTVEKRRTRLLLERRAPLNVVQLAELEGQVRQRGHLVLAVACDRRWRP